MTALDPGHIRAALPRLGLGSAPLAGLYSAVEEEVAVGAVKRAFDAGVRYFDTAPAYGYGLSEERLGRALGGIPRAEFMVSTKVGRLLRTNGAGLTDESIWSQVHNATSYFDFSREAVLTSLKTSYSRLGLDHVDLALIHDPDEHFELARDGAYRALAELRATGEVRWIGVGANSIDVQLRFAAETDIDCFLIAGRYTLLDHERTLRDYFPVCQEKGISVIVAGVFNGGILADPSPGAYYNYAPAPDELLRKAGDIKAVCDRFEVPLRAPHRHA